MVFSRFFSKDAAQLQAKGDKLFAAGHYVDARHTYREALDKLGATDEQSERQQHLCTQISKAGNKLAELNIVEAEAAMRSGNLQKMAEHLQLSLELADDVSLREKAEGLLSTSDNVNHNPVIERVAHQKHGCATCSSTASPGTEVDAADAGHLSAAEQFQLLVSTLPGDLPQRYHQLGEKFASAYLLAHEEQSAEAMALLKELLSTGENDIILYETALLHFRAGDAAGCEKLLLRALQMNGENPLSYLGLAQLYIDMARHDEALAILATMLEREMLADQALVMFADVHTLKGDYDRAIEIFTSALSLPTLKKVAAERLVRILAGQGRDEEAAYLVKTYLKGCC